MTAHEDSLTAVDLPQPPPRKTASLRAAGNALGSERLVQLKGSAVTEYLLTHSGKDDHAPRARARTRQLDQPQLRRRS